MYKLIGFSPLPAARLQPVCIGKPAGFAFELALDVLKLNRRDVIIVGVRIHTDLQGAAQRGFRSVLVRAGEFNPRERLSSPNFPHDQINSSFTELPEVLLGWTENGQECLQGVHLASGREI